MIIIIIQIFRWLMSQGKSDRAVEVMRRIARINKKEVIMII